MNEPKDPQLFKVKNPIITKPIGTTGESAIQIFKSL